MKTLEEIDVSAESTLDTAPDGRPWRSRRLRHRRRIAAACVSMMPTVPTDDPETIEAWHLRAQEQCGIAITTIIGMAVLSWLIQKLCDWLYERWKNRHVDEWHDLQLEACRFLKQEED